MDTLAEQFENEDGDLAFALSDELKIGCLEWVDDVVTCTSGIINQKKVFQLIFTHSCQKRRILRWKKVYTECLRFN